MKIEKIRLFNDTALREYAEKVAVNKMITMAISNGGFCDMAHNMIVSMRESKVTNLLLISLDNQSNKCFDDLSISYFHENFTANRVDSTSQNFLEGSYLAIVDYKLKYLLRLLKMGYDVIVSDTDTIWVKDPVSVLENARDSPNFPVLFIL